MTPLASLVLPIIIVILVPKFQANAERMDEAEDRLHRQLFNNYSKYVRPNENGEPVLYYFGVGLSILFDVDEKQQILKTGGWTQQEWNDSRLRWDPASFNRIYDTIIPTEWIWSPVMSINGIRKEQSYLSETETVRLTYDGTVRHFPGDKFETPCTLDIRLFPFDKQKCQLVFSSWYLPNHALKITAMDEIMLPSYQQHVEWDLVSTSSIVRDTISRDGNATSKKRSIIYVIHLQRRPLYYIVNIILPSIVQSGISLFVFWLPCDAGEKLSFSVSILISTSIFSVMVADIMPVTSETIPLIMQLLYFNFMVVAVSIVLSILVLRVHYRPQNNSAMTSNVRRIFLQVLPPYIGLKRYHQENGIIHPMKDITPHQNTNLEIFDVKDEHSDEDLSTTVGGKSESMCNIVADTKTTNVKVTSEEKVSTNEEPLSPWKHLALVLDRICFVSLSITYFIGIASILLQA
ncbi:acetylcholine receptor subunit alpha-type unc-63-like [Ptychodera flava]|uniref:acetylcholine receptor subunit alpha-type unc-63-like n=1 Tax=Ptychodera flava TaxID=63121 RepID=UPI003969DCDA